MDAATADTIEMFCDPCGDDRQFLRETRPETMCIRSEQISALIPLLVCPVCGDTQPDHTSDVDSIQVFYDEYRRKHAMLMPDEIRSLRERYGLSREAFAGLFGMSAATLYRYEVGALQDDIHEQLLRSCEDPAQVIRVVRRHRDRLTDLQYRRFTDALAAWPQPLRSETWSESTATADVYSGNRCFDYQRYALLVCLLCQAGGPIFKTKLNKELFYADFNAFLLLGRSISGSRYRAIQHGPVPADFDALLEAMENEGFVETSEVDFNEFSGTVVKAGPRAPNPSEPMDPRESSIIQFVAHRFDHVTAAEIRRMSHEEKAWIETHQRKLISYDWARDLKIRPSESDLLRGH